MDQQRRIGERLDGGALEPSFGQSATAVLERRCSFGQLVPELEQPLDILRIGLVGLYLMLYIKT